MRWEQRWMICYATAWRKRGGRLNGRHQIFWRIADVYKRQLLELPQSGTATQKAMADRWIADWRMKDDLIRLARDMCVEKIGKVHCSYIDKILEHWHLDGIDTVEKAKADSQPAAKKKPQKETSLDMDAYMEQGMSRAPVYKGNSSK